MPFSPERRPGTLSGVLFVALFAVAAFQIASWPGISALKLSPLVIGIVLGMAYANTLRQHLPAPWVPGVVFSAKTLLRVGVALYGFRLTLQQLAEVGPVGLLLSLIMVTTTFLLGAFVGQRILKLDRDTAWLTAVGSAVCGAAAVLATEPVLKAKPYKSAVAVGTVVFFGTLAMFLYPLMQRSGLLGLDPTAYGLYVGSTVHEVAHVVAAGAAVPGAAKVAVVVKMTRVVLLAPLLLVLGFLVARGEGGKKAQVPAFALWFLAAIGFNSLGLLPPDWVAAINRLDTFLLTMAMTALGMETSAEKLRAAGPKPMLEALVMALWLAGGGYLLVRFFTG
jgi:uncharacterized integral membrane protein (TIGR00698 family)